jgi:hypothetical protein
MIFCVWREQLLTLSHNFTLKFHIENLAFCEAVIKQCLYEMVKYSHKFLLVGQYWQFANKILQTRLIKKPTNYWTLFSDDFSKN